MSPFWPAIKAHFTAIGQIALGVRVLLDNQLRTFFTELLPSDSEKSRIKFERPAKIGKCKILFRIREHANKDRHTITTPSRRIQVYSKAARHKKINFSCIAGIRPSARSRSQRSSFKMAERISETAARSPATTFDIRDYRLSDSGRPRWRPGSRDQAGSRSDGRKEHWRDDVCASRQFRSEANGTNARLSASVQLSCATHRIELVRVVF